MAMDDTLGPMTARKYFISRSQSTSSSLSFPQIPRRSSSLAVSASSHSDDPITSTRTPSLSDSLYQIQVAKIRQPHIPNSRIKSPKLSTGDDSFIDKDFVTLTHKKTQLHRASNVQTPRLVVRWSSGSWNFPDSPLCSRSIEPFVDEDNRQSLPINPTSGRLNSLCPMDLPIASINVAAFTKTLQIGMQPESLWTTIQVTADINSTSLPGSSIVAPLDIIILLDTMTHPSVNMLTQVTLGSSVLASHLVYNQDRIALASIDQEDKLGFKLLLPLGHHSIETTRSALNKFSQRQLFSATESSPNTGVIIKNICRIFYEAPRAAFCHLFFISANPLPYLSVPSMDQGIGFHTITPRQNLPLDSATSQLGWHISYSIGTNDVGPKEVHFIRKVSKVLRQLRTGTRPGSIANLNMTVTPSDGCQIQSIKDHFRLNYLRPGEIWTIPIQVRIPAANLYLQQDPPRIVGQHPMIEEMLAQIDFLLQEYSSLGLTQPIFTAHVEYQHSLFAVPSSVHIETQLSVLRQGFA